MDSFRREIVRSRIIQEEFHPFTRNDRHNSKATILRLSTTYDDGSEDNAFYDTRFYDLFSEAWDVAEDLASNIDALKALQALQPEFDAELEDARQSGNRRRIMAMQVLVGRFRQNVNRLTENIKLIHQFKQVEVDFRKYLSSMVAIRNLDYVMDDFDLERRLRDEVHDVREKAASLILRRDFTERLDQLGGEERIFGFNRDTAIVAVFNVGSVRVAYPYNVGSDGMRDALGGLHPSPEASGSPGDRGYRAGYVPGESHLLEPTRDDVLAAGRIASARSHVGTAHNECFLKAGTRIDRLFVFSKSRLEEVQDTLRKIGSRISVILWEPAAS